MGRFVFSKPVAFQDAHIIAGKDQGIGFFITQGRRFDPSSDRVCEDVHFVSNAGSTFACGILDGHGGAACAQVIARMLADAVPKACEGDLGANASTPCSPHQRTGLHGQVAQGSALTRRAPVSVRCLSSFHGWVLMLGA